jgi:hypothetical protein
MVKKGASVHPRLKGLLGREIACLRLGKPIEAVVVDPVRHTREIIPQTSDTTRPLPP